VIVRDEADRAEAIKLIKSWKLEKPMEVIGRVYKKNRSAAQNAIFAIWTRERGNQTGHGEIHERCLAKLSFGVPIMQRHLDFAELWQPYSLMPYEFQLNAMKIVDVTSLMNIQEMNECITAFEDDCHENNIHLTKPQMYQEAMNR